MERMAQFTGKNNDIFGGESLKPSAASNELLELEYNDG